MSKRTRYADNSKRRQPVQQQRAQAALQTINQKKSAKLGGEQQQGQQGQQERSAEQSSGERRQGQGRQ